MKKMIQSTALILLSALLFSACTSTPKNPANTQGDDTVTTTTTTQTEQTTVTTPKTEETTPEPKEKFSVLEGALTEQQGRYSSGRRGVTALYNGKELTSGAISAQIVGGTDQKAGLIFGYSKDGDNEQYYRFCTNKAAQRVELELVKNGKAEQLYSNYLSAGYNTASMYSYRVVIENSVAYCYFWNTLYAIQKLDNPGTQVGIYSKGNNSIFRNVSVSADKTHDQADTLIYGHSYMEMWTNWKLDIGTIKDEFGLGTVMNAGIGGSVASHWYRFKDSLVAYGAKKGIYMIGINDLTGGTSPASVVASIKDTLLYVKDSIPEYEVVLLSVNHCPARNQIRTQISETNGLMQKLAAQYDWIYYAEVEYAFCDNGSTPDNYWFIDGLHPSSAGYKQKLIPAIQSALRGENQPTLDDDVNAQLLESAKSIRYCQIIDYCEKAFRAEEWKTAKPLYEAAVAAIEACKTPDEVAKLDLSTYIEQLDQIKNVGDYSYEELLSGENCDKWETDVFKNALESGKDGSFTLTHDGHRLNNNTLYTDMTFKFKLGDVTGNFDVAGPLFHASQSDALGIQGYMINIVTEPNYLQVWYFEECFGTANKNMHYIGGWVFPEEVEDTEFRAVIEGNMIYIYTEEDYQTKGKDAYGCSVDLSNNGQLKPYEYGAYGILCWNSNTGAKGDMIISDVQGTPYQP
ncbi:MAG: hypothetical protein IJW98_03540 [Clostridia bacterium]|nr:hypothetical protein [Clostridia bacterium]